MNNLVETVSRIALKDCILPFPTTERAFSDKNTNQEID